MVCVFPAFPVACQGSVPLRVPVPVPARAVTAETCVCCCSPAPGICHVKCSANAGKRLFIANPVISQQGRGPWPLGHRSDRLGAAESAFLLGEGGQAAVVGQVKEIIELGKKAACIYLSIH